jgi:elongation factor 2
MAEEERLKKFARLVSLPINIRNVCTSAHIHHGKTALTDNLMAAAGLMAEKFAGDLSEGMMTWQHSDEQERLLTVDSANVSMLHDFQGQEYLINLIDTPGHVDFGGNVTRAMRAIDGTVVLVCASEGIMPQTETVIKQALRERVKPILFINKVDRLVKEVKLTPEAMQQRFIKIVTEFNQLIEELAEPEFKQAWKVDIKEGSVAFGSAKENWALSLPYMLKKGVGFKDVLKTYEEMDDKQRKEWMWKNAPLFEVFLDMIIKHLPNPLVAQKYRIPKIWLGDKDSQLGKDLINCNPNGKLAFVVTRIVIDPKSGKEISAGRLFSGTMRPGTEVYMNLAKQRQKVQQVFIYDGIFPKQLDAIPAGNVLAISGVVGQAGETITLEPEQPFEELRHIFEPVVTKSIEPMKPIDLPKLIEVLRKVSKEDPSVKIKINEETGENLISGMGELHLEIIENRIKTEKNVDIKTSPPLVVYRESIQKPCSKEYEGRSPNKHNVFYIRVEPLEDSVYQAIKNGEIQPQRLKKKNEELWKKLNTLGISNEEARQYRMIYGSSVFLDKTKGEVHIGEVIEMVMDAIEQVLDAGPLVKEPCIRLKISLVDLKLHEDAIHRGPAQIYPAVRDSMRLAMFDSKMVLFEPVQELLIEAPVKYLGEVSKLVQSKRGQLLDVQQEGDRVNVRCALPVVEMFGLAGDLRGNSEGRASFSVVDQVFSKLSPELQEKYVRQIKQRKGITD